MSTFARDLPWVVLLLAAVACLAAMGSLGGRAANPALHFRLSTTPGCWDNSSFNFEFNDGPDSGRYRAQFTYTVNEGQKQVLTETGVVTHQEAERFEAELEKFPVWTLPSRNTVIGPDTFTFELFKGTRRHRFSLCLAPTDGPGGPDEELLRWAYGPQALIGRAFRQCLQKARKQGYLSPIEG